MGYPIYEYEARLARIAAVCGRDANRPILAGYEFTLTAFAKASKSKEGKWFPNEDESAFETLELRACVVEFTGN